MFYHGFFLWYLIFEAGWANRHCWVHARHVVFVPLCSFISCVSERPPVAVVWFSVFVSVFLQSQSTLSTLVNMCRWIASGRCSRDWLGALRRKPIKKDLVGDEGEDTQNEHRFQRDAWKQALWYFKTSKQQTFETFSVCLIFFELGILDCLDTQIFSWPSVLAAWLSARLDTAEEAVVGCWCVQMLMVLRQWMVARLDQVPKCVKKRHPP